MKRVSGPSLVVALVSAALLAPAAAHAAPPVTNTNDSGPGSLRDAIGQAGGGETVSVPAGTYTLTSGQLVVNKTLTIAGAGARSTIITAGGSSRVLQATGTPVTVSGVTITGGKLTLTGTDACGQGGAGICFSGDLVLNDVAVSGNVVTSSVIGSPGVGGGGIYKAGSTLTITGSTISGNQASVTNAGSGSGGGGIYVNGAGPQITNTTIAGNVATINGSASNYGGGGVYLNGGPPGTFTSTTIAGNTAGGSATTAGGNVFVNNTVPPTVKNSIVANGSAPVGSNCGRAASSPTAFSSAGGNLESADTCNFTAASDKRNTAPLLGPLADNGGQTDTMALGSGSPAIDSAIGCPPPATDQRGVVRPQQGACDIGAFESVPSPLGAPGPPSGLPAPRLGRTMNVQVVRGRVYVSLPGNAAFASLTVPGLKGRRFVPVTAARQIPMGSLLDTRRGTIRITTAGNASGSTLQSGEFASGVFQVLQSRRASAKGLTDLRLKGSSFAGCRSSARGQGTAFAALSRRVVRRLRSRASGRFRTGGRYSAATVRGTTWLTADRCDGTLTRVSRGRVVVRDFRRRKNITLRAGKSYLARAPV